MNNIEKALMHGLFIHLHHNIDKAIDFGVFKKLNDTVAKASPGSLLIGPDANDDAAVFKMPDDVRSGCSQDGKSLLTLCIEAL